MNDQAFFLPTDTRPDNLPPLLEMVDALLSRK